MQLFRVLSSKFRKCKFMKKIQKKAMFSEWLYPLVCNSPDLRKPFLRLPQKKLFFSCITTKLHVYYIYTCRVRVVSARSYLSYATRPLMLYKFHGTRVETAKAVLLDQLNPNFHSKNNRYWFKSFKWCSNQ
jgi:hypothetical protein